MGNRFTDKVVIVTGAASGIGKSCVTRFVAEGAKVAALDVDEANLAALAEGEAAIVPIRCDVSNPDAVAAAVEKVAAELARVDVLVNNAGIANPKRVRLHEQALEDWERVMAVNIGGLFLMQRAVIPHMLAQGGGAIINMASIGSFRATAMSAPYITSKGAALLMTRAASIEYAKDNIRINAVCPGTTNTEILAGSSPEFIETLVARAPQGELVEPEEVAALVAFLASDEVPHITGSSYIIDAGRSAT